MSRTKTKICGITSPQDAIMCHGLGADYLGVIFAESPRKITVARAREIREAAPEAALVGVFSDSSVEAVLETARRCGLDLIQLHGSESPEFVAALSEGFRLPVIKALKAGMSGGGVAACVSGAGLAAGAAGGTDRRGGTECPAALSEYESSAFFLFDLDKTSASSAGYRTALWDDAATAVGSGYRVFLAGGLTPENVGAAVKRVRPYCVDVCAGVEAAPGVKDAVAVQSFISGVGN